MLEAAVAGLLLAVAIGEIIASWRKSRPIPYMQSLSPQDATAIIGSAPVLLHPRQTAASDSKPTTGEVIGN